jgi:hypothetical protein
MNLYDDDEHNEFVQNFYSMYPNYKRTEFVKVLTVADMDDCIRKL